MSRLCSGCNAVKDESEFFDESGACVSCRRPLDKEAGRDESEGVVERSGNPAEGDLKAVEMDEQATVDGGGAVGEDSKTAVEGAGRAEDESSNVFEGKEDDEIPEEVIIDKLKKLVKLIQYQREMKDFTGKADENIHSGSNPDGNSTSVNSSMQQNHSNTKNSESYQSTFGLDLQHEVLDTSEHSSLRLTRSHEDFVSNEDQDSPSKKQKVDEISSTNSNPVHLIEIHQMYHLLNSFLSGCFTLKPISSLLHVNAVLSVPALKTLLLSQKFLLRPFRFYVPKLNFHQLTGYKDILDGSLCFGELIFLMIIINLPSIQSFDLVQEMLCTHLNFQVYLDTSKSMHSSPHGHITCKFFWSTRGKLVGKV